jgi:membrane protein DedA with SNARE-associated domain
MLSGPNKLIFFFFSILFSLEIRTFAPVMEEIILHLTNGALDNLNYGWVILFMAIESSFIPFPSEVVMIPAAYMAAETGEMSYSMIILCGTM